MKKLLAGLLVFGSVSVFAENCVLKTTESFLSTFPEISDELNAKGYLLDTSVELDQADFTLVTRIYKDPHCRRCQFPKKIDKYIWTITMRKLNKSNDGKIYQTTLAEADGSLISRDYPTPADFAGMKKKAANDFLRKVRNSSCK